MKFIIKISFTIISLLFLLACSKKEAEKTSVETEKSETNVTLSNAQFTNAHITFGKVEHKNIPTTLEVNGMLDVPPQNLVSVSAIMGGFVKSTNLLQGKWVKKGEVIVTMQNIDFINLQSQYLENKQKMVFLEQEYTRQQELSKENVTATKTFQQISAEYKSMQATQGALAEKLQLLNINPQSLSQENIRSVVNIYSPIDGYVTVVNVNVGKFVNPQDVICEIVDSRHLHAELTVFEKDITKLKIGQKLRFVLVNESNKERTGSIYLINKSISAERTVRVHAHLDKEDQNLIPNMYLKAFIDIENENLTVLPEKAIVTAGDKNYIFLKQNADKETHTFKIIEITKGITNNGYTAISATNLDTNAIVVEGAYDILSVLKNTEEVE